MTPENAAMMKLLKDNLSRVHGSGPQEEVVWVIGEGMLLVVRVWASGEVTAWVKMLEQ